MHMSCKSRLDITAIRKPIKCLTGRYISGYASTKAAAMQGCWFGNWADEKTYFKFRVEYESPNAKAEDFRLINMVNAVKIGMYRIEEGGAE